MTKILVSFTGTATQIPVPANPIARTILDTSEDHHLVPKAALVHYPDMLTGHDPKHVHPDHGLMYQATPAPGSPIIRVSTLDWAALLSLLSFSLCGRDRSLTLRYPQNYQGSMPLWSLIAMSAMTPTVFSPDTTRLLASDFRALNRGGHWNRLDEKLKVSAVQDHREMVHVFREGVLNSARVGGIVVFGQEFA